MRSVIESGRSIPLAAGVFCCALIVTLFSLQNCSDNNSTAKTKSAHYVGRKACTGCHADIAATYAGSDHERAMQEATDSTVLGDFDDLTVEIESETVHFFRSDSGFFVLMLDTTGLPVNYRIEYTFGVYPLQQYLVAFPGGRLQTLPYCWDTRAKEAGGKRWFHIYGENVKAHDPRFWTRISQNWNQMCAECHSTNLQKKYDLNVNSYTTSWSEIDVSCEACHGPGSSHIEWANKTPAKADEQKGLLGRNVTADHRIWLIDTISGNATLTDSKAAKNNEVEMCARCHSRRVTISADYVQGEPLANTHLVNLPKEPLYYPDGQVREEVYEYGSFLQSKMYAAGVICSDCHDPHSAKVATQTDALCFKCHYPIKYDSESHHHHEPGFVTCVDCHMPERTYMQIDQRRDHSFRVPRPDLSPVLGMQNACTQCHVEGDTSWFAKFAGWYPRLRQTKRIGQIAAEAASFAPKARAELLDYVCRPSISAIMRAVAVSTLSRYPIPVPDSIMTALVSDSSALVRLQTIALLQAYESEYRSKILSSLVRDSVRSVRIAAAWEIASSKAALLTHNDSLRLASALRDYEAAQKLNADHPSGRMNLANLHVARQEYTQAEHELQMAIVIEPLFAPAYINLADVYRLTDNESGTLQILIQGSNLLPHNASLHHALGLALVRSANRNDALEHFRRANRLEPREPLYAYVYAIALAEAGQSEEARMVVSYALTLNPYDVTLLQCALSLAEKTGNMEEVLTIRTRLAEVMSSRNGN